MKDAYDLLGTILSIFKLPLAWWTVTLFIIAYFQRERIAKAINDLLDLFGRKVATSFGSRRFEAKYKELVRANHLHLKIVGIRTEEERRPKISDAYVPLMLLQQNDTIDHAISVDQMLRNHQQPYNLILGDPGSGKSTILDYITVQHTEPPIKQKTNITTLLTPGRLPRRPHTPCPIYIPLRRCSMSNETLLDDILDKATEILPLSIRQIMPKGFIEHCLTHNNALLLLDGLDEVADQKAYDSVVRKVNEFIQMYPKIQIVVTCRKAGWRGGLNADPDFLVYSVLSLDAQQQHSFVHKWYPAVLRYIATGIPTSQQELLRRAEREANNLLTLLHTRERLRELASNPLILSLICLVHKQRKDLPRGRAALYKDCIDILLELWDRTDKDFDQLFPTTDQKKLLLRNIAYRMHSKGMREVDRKTLENWVQEFLPDDKKDIMRLDNAQQEQLREALLSAFPTRQDLEMMVFDQFNVNLSVIVGESNLQYIVFKLVQWAVARGRLDQLVIAALKENSQNPQLKSIAQQLGLSNDQSSTSRSGTHESVSHIPTYSSIASGMQYKISPAEIVRQIEVRSGLMVERAIDLLAFSHLTFQEFLIVEYINHEQNGDIDLATITDWSAWREPVLLMCGMKNAPMPFIEALYQVYPMLALSGIAEAEPAKLDIGKAQTIIDNAISRVPNQEILLTDAIPALVELLSVKSNPFEHSVISFISNIVYKSGLRDISDLAAELAKIPTRESARVLLNLLSATQQSEIEEILLNSLARIGDSAIYEALDWQQQGMLTEELFFKFLLNCYTPFATKTLWMRYELTPPQGQEIAWAKSWALRLADREQDRVLRGFMVAGPGVSDPDVWPYRQNDRCVIAAIVKKVVTILQPVYLNWDEISNDLDIFSRFALRVLVTLLVEPDYQIIPINIIHKLYLEYANAGKINREGMVLEFTRHDFYTIGRFLQGQDKKTVQKRLGLLIGSILEVISCCAVSAGIVALLLSYPSLWTWIPRISGFLALIIILWIVGMFWVYDFVISSKDRRRYISYSIIVTVVLPMLWFYAIMVVDSHRTIEKILSLKKIKWTAALYMLGGSLLAAIFGFFALHFWLSHWLIGTDTPYVYVPLLTIIFFFAIILSEYSLAFSKNPLATWVQNHPRGAEIIDEFTFTESR